MERGERDYGGRGQRGKIQNRSYLNDDYTKYAGPNYRETHYYDDFEDQEFELRDPEESRWNRSRFADPYSRRQKERPGVSGKSYEEGSWFNESNFHRQENFIGKGPKGYRRSDARINEEVCEALKANPYIDASEIEVKVQDGIVSLDGVVDTRMIRHKVENIIDGMPGVEDIHNGLKVSRNVTRGQYGE